jgi:hypothetical protein
MSTSYPTSLQDLDATRGTASQSLSSPSHVTHHTNEDDTIEALETKVGVDNSAVTSSIDYKLKNSASINPGHKHTLAAGISDVTITTPVNGNGLFYNGSAWVNTDVNVADASTTVKGVTKMSTAPAVANNPIAVGDNDARVPTTDENDALAGTSGTPSSSNKYVTNDDTATAATASKVARRLAGGNITVVTESQGNNSTNAASTAYVDAYSPLTKNGIATRAGNTASGSQTIAHGLGRTPKKVRIYAIHSYTSYLNNHAPVSDGSYDGTNTACLYRQGNLSGGDGPLYNSDTSKIIYLHFTGSGAYARQDASVSVDATNITLTWTLTESSASYNSANIIMLWEVQ